MGQLVSENWQTFQGARVTGKGQDGWTGNRTDATPYDMIYGLSQTYDQLPNGSYFPIDVPNSRFVPYIFDPSKAQPAYNRAYEDWVAAARGGVNAQMLTFMAEGGEALGLISKRTKNLVDAAEWLNLVLRRRPNPRYLKLLKQRRRLYTPNGFAVKAGPRWDQRIASLQLEWSFGWAPAVADIGSALDVLGRDFGVGELLKGKGRFSTLARFDNPPYEERYVSVTVGVNQFGRATIVNPNLAFADSMGVLSIGQTLFEIIPFSFLADWCFDVSTYLGSWTDLAGYDITDTFYSVLVKDAIEHFSIEPWWTPPGSVYHTHLVGGGMRRRGGMVQPLPNFEVRSNLGYSTRRVANALSLLSILIKSN